ncbi:MAG TPA: PAS domain S-box protein [Caldilineaceae bacterium]|nr:PAS domain S-box protein [Caldilineaceae bacterium]
MTTRFPMDPESQTDPSVLPMTVAQFDVQRAPSWLKSIDFVLVITGLLLLLTEQAIFYFHLIFVVLTFGAFYWRLQAFMLRAGVAVSVTSVALAFFVFSGRIPRGELIEIPMLLFILLLVFTIARQRTFAEDALRQTNENLEHRILTRTGALRQEMRAHQATIQTLRTSEERYRHLVQLSFEAIMIHREDEIVSLNPAGMALFGVTNAKELEGKAFLEFVHPDERGAMAMSLRRVHEAHKGVPPAEWRMTRLDGQTIAVEMATIPIRHDGQQALQTVIRDITVRREAEQARLDERMRIARDLHDSLGQSLGYLHLKLDEFADHAPPGIMDKYADDFTRMRSVANTAYEQVRGLLAALLPSNISKLAESLRQRAAAMHQEGALPIQVISHGREQTLPAVLQQQIFSLCCEALANVVKHAQASHAHVELWWEVETLTIVIEDDGQGFDVTAPPSSNSFGLRIMQDRAAQMNGQLEIQSQHLRGTTLRLQVPIENG